MKCTVSFIISVCLSGQICVWDIATGDCLRVINRKRLVCLPRYFFSSSFLCLSLSVFVSFSSSRNKIVIFIFIAKANRKKAGITYFFLSVVFSLNCWGFFFVAFLFLFSFLEDI